MNSIKQFFQVGTMLVFFSIAAQSFAQDSALSDGDIIGIYNQVNGFDIETALLAQSKSTSEDILQLARSVANDHRSVRLAAAELANQIGANVTLPALRQAAAEQFFETIANLAALEGEEFDAAYLRHEIGFHSAAMEAVRSILLPAASHSALVEHFQSVLPHFEHHLSQTIEVAKRLGYYED